MNTAITAYFAFGMCFGLATFTHRHLFSEGPTRPAEAAEKGNWQGRLTWALVCACLWPIMVLTGIYSLFRLARKRADREPR